MNLTSPKLSVIVPCYNPTTGWFDRFCERLAELHKDVCNTEIIIINDGSTNNFYSSSIVQQDLPNKYQITSISYKINRGKGYALRKGVKKAKGDIIIYTDIDFPYTHQSLLTIYSELKKNGSDVVIGIRGEEYYAHLPKTRVRISKLLRWFIKKFLRIPTDDTQCGLKGMNQKGKEVFLTTTIDRYLFDLEFIFLAARRELNIKTVTVELRPEIVLSKMNWKILLQEFGNFLKIFVRSI